MRRLVLILFMFLLPLQWSWAAAGSACEHEESGAHFGHHVHKHDAASHEASSSVEEPTDRTYGEHPDCDACHGLSAGVLASIEKLRTNWAGDKAVSSYGRYLPDPPVKRFLRPPLVLVA